MRLGLVLGAGGTVGIAYHTGALRALEEVAGLRADDADVVVGTSAGAFVGAYARSGFSAADAWELVVGSPAPGESAEELAARRAGIFAPAFSGPVELTRRGLGSLYVLGRAAARVPLPLPPAALRDAFPGGLFDMVEGRRRMTAELPDTWPERPLRLCAVNVVTGRRVVLGERDASTISLHDAVAASCAIPGLYRPVRIGRATLVDGGVHSTTNLDVAARAGCRLILCIAPMAYDPTPAPSAVQQLARRLPARVLAREVAAARARGAEVLLVRPTAAEVRLHGLNLMRRTGWDAVARAAYDATARLLETPRFRRGLDGLAAGAPAQPRGRSAATTL